MRYYKKTVVLLLLALTISSVDGYAQIGIYTEKPLYDLDINGSLQIRNELRVDGGAVVADPGKAGQALVSKGAALPPAWEDINIEKPIGKYKLSETLFALDRIGISMDQSKSYTDKILEQESLAANNWTTINGLNLTLTTTKAKNRIVVTLQTTAQSDYNGGYNTAGDWLEFACGIFINNELRAARKNQTNGIHGPTISFVLLYSFDDLPVGDYNLQVAFQRRSASNSLEHTNLYVGKPALLASPNSNEFMNKSMMRVDVFEERN